MLLAIHCPFSSMSITPLLPCVLVSCCLRVREEMSWVSTAIPFSTSGPAREGNEPPVALDKHGLLILWASGQYICFVRCSLYWDAKRVPATNFINSTISRSEFIATNTMPFSMCCARGIFFDTTCDLLLFLNKCWQALHSWQSKTAQCVTNC